jgi:uncharacterized surface protein with fasciclin (FAS1) repeats
MRSLPVFTHSLLALVLTAACATTSKDAPAVAEPTTTEPAPSAKNIVDVAVEAGKFTTLAKALAAAGLVETLQGPGPFTVFAPTDEAFAKLPAGALDQLLANPEQLKAVLLLHVVSGKVMASDVATLTEATAMSGGKLPIDTRDGVKVGAATVISADVEASNGVIHVIDTVLLPQ